ncbi:MAG: PilT/PilU family type 4a pilus ATPase [Kiritimatiellae bacterium]|nr:PilT/PilU family type 4a pilus ATPase [Kiritimatiellia bacterium]
MNSLLESLFSVCEENHASDIHLATGQKPRFRIRGALVEKGDYRPFDVKAIDAITMDLGLVTLPLGCPDGTERIRTTLLRDGSIDGAVSSLSGARYRFNLFRERDRHAVALRRLDGEFHTFPELGLPRRLADFCNENDGLVVVTGPTGSGKSTTLATMIDLINHTRPGHIITIEDPIEFLHTTDRCLVNQRQVGRDTRSFNDALVDALREDPDVILVGEIRDIDTIRTALRAAETGHLVFTTLHAGDCAGAVERLISVFPADEQSSARHQLALVLRGIFAQHLLPNADKSGRVPAYELLVNTAAVANLIATGRTAQIYSLLETNSALGMCTLEKSLTDLVLGGKILEQSALAFSRNAEALKRRIDRHA